MNSCDISVIIPVKNRAQLLRRTLDNLLSQSKKPDEIIVIDDHSTDDFKLVVFDYITECTFLNNKGTGPGAARNLGLSVANGRYIQFFDSDDLLSKDKLKAQFEAMESSGADMAYGPYVKASEQNDGSWKQEDVVMQAFPIPSNHSLAEWMLRGWNALTQACLFRRTFLDKVPLWDEKLITHEDYLYLYRLSLKKPSLVHVPGEGVLYRQHGTQSTDLSTVNTSRGRDQMEVLTRLREVLPDDADFWSQQYLKGRMAMQLSWLQKNGVDTRPYLGYISSLDSIWQWPYRLYNRNMRKATGSAWEPMHGVSKDPSYFQYIANSIIYG